MPTAENQVEVAGGSPRSVRGIRSGSVRPVSSAAVQTRSPHAACSQPFVSASRMPSSRTRIPCQCSPPVARVSSKIALSSGCFRSASVIASAGGTPTFACTSAISKLLETDVLCASLMFRLPL